MNSETIRGFRGFGIALAWVVLSTAAVHVTEASVRVCPDESEAMLSDGTIRRQSFRAVEDPSAGGVLRRRRAAGDAPAPTKMILMLDYSGSMYPGYNRQPDAGCAVCAERTFYYQLPRFHQLLGRWLDAASPVGTDIQLEILLFNAHAWRLGGDGSVERFTGAEQLTFERPVSTASAAQIADWLAQIPGHPRQVDGTAYLTTESRQALIETVTAVATDEIGEAIVWLVTDNIVDTGGAGVSAEDAQRNLAFYNTLKVDPRIQMIATYPVLEAQTCSWMCGTSLFVYGMYVSAFERPDSAASHRLGGTEPAGANTGGSGPTADGLLWNAALRDVAAEVAGHAATADPSATLPDVAGVPLRLKPIDTEVLSLDFQLHGGQALNCDRSAEYGDALLCLAEIRVRNTLRHQSVDSAHLSLHNQVMLPRKPFERQRLPWASAVCAGQMEPLQWLVKGEGRPTTRGGADAPIEVGPLPPLGSATVEVLFRLPPIDVASSLKGGGRQHLLDVALTPQILLDGRMVAEMRDIRTSLAIDPARLQGIYGTAQLPALFRGRQQGYLWAEYPAAAVLSNNGQLFGLLVLLGGGSLLLLVLLAVLRFQRLQYTVWVDGVEHARLSLPRLSRRDLDIDGAVRARLHRGWGPRARFKARPGHRLRKDGGSWILATGHGDGDGFEYRLDVRRGWKGRGISGRGNSDW